MGRIRLTGATSGYTELRAASTAGNNTITLPTTNGGEVVVSDSSGNVNIDSGTFYVDAVNNRVGVGSNAASYLLDLLGSAPRIRVKDSSTGAAFHHFENNSGNFYLGIDNSTGGSLSAGNYARVLWSQGAYPLVFATNDTQRAQIDSSGRLLVGTSTTSNSLVTCLLQGNAAGSISYAGLTLARGVATPADGDYLGEIDFSDNTHTASAIIRAQRDGGTWSGSSKPTALVLSTCADGAAAPVERMRIDSSGRATIGSSVLADAALTIARSAAAGGAYNRTVASMSNSVATSTTKATNSLMRLGSNASGADINIVFTDGNTYNYFFGGNNGGAYVMSGTNGVRLSSGGTSWAADSDERVKDIIEPIEDGLEKVATLRAVIGKYKTDAGDTRRSFLIAQDVQAVLPEAVFDEQGTLMLAYSDTIPLLVAALKDAKELIETQGGTIADLLTRVDALEAA